jgi:hypothetical protein
MPWMPLGWVGASGATTAATFELISTTVLASTTTSVTFSITGAQQAAYKHLQLRATTRTDRASQTSDRLYVQFNSDSGSNYYAHNLWGDGSTVQSGNGWGGLGTSIILEGGSFGAAATSGFFVASVTDILDAFSTSKYKVLRSLNGAPSSRVQLNSGNWNNTAAVSSITLSAIGSFVTGSRFSLYGVRA